MNEEAENQASSEIIDLEQLENEEDRTDTQLPTRKCGDYEEEECVIDCTKSEPGSPGRDTSEKQEINTKEEESEKGEIVQNKPYNFQAVFSSFASENIKLVVPPETWRNTAWVQSSPKVTRLLNESLEEYNERCIKLKLKYLNSLKNETPTQREERLKKMRDRGRTRRSEETKEEREIRLEKLRLRQTHRLINETHEQKQYRLEQMRIRAARRLANETPEQREIRLSKMRQNAARRLANETAEEREYRLSMLRSYRSRNLAGEVRKINKNYSPQLSNEPSDFKECDVTIIMEPETLVQLENSECSLNDNVFKDSLPMSNSTTENSASCGADLD